MLEELLAQGHAGAEYDAWLINIGEGDQFGSGFVAANPNSKIPALLDRSGSTPIRVFESGAILQYLAEKFGGAFLPAGGESAPNACHGCSGRWAARPFLAAGSDTSMRTRRRRSNTPSTGTRWRSSANSTCSTGASPKALSWREIPTPLPTWPYGPGTELWSRASSMRRASSFRSRNTANVLRWTDQIAQRPAVQRGRMVNRTWGQPQSQLHERHDAGDFDTKTQDKLDTRRG